MSMNFCGNAPLFSEHTGKRADDKAYNFAAASKKTPLKEEARKTIINQSAKICTAARKKKAIVIKMRYFDTNNAGNGAKGQL